MSDNRFNYYDLGPKVINSKSKYRDAQQNNKLTYNFVTDPRLRRGHNFGVIYVSNTNYEEEGLKKSGEHAAAINQMNAQRYALRKAEERAQYENQRNLTLDQRFKDFGIATEKVKCFEMPTPITFEVEVQTDPLPPKEQEKFEWPAYTGIEVGTQIEDNDLFNFDKEVKPLVQIIVSKIIEESRREVLEEEEREEIKRSMLKYQQLNKEDAERVKNIEEMEKKRFEERLKKKEEKIKRVQLAKVFQKKLVCRTISKSYLGNLLHNTLDVLGKRGKFKSKEVDEYFTLLLPNLFNIAEKENTNDYKYSGGFTEMINKAVKNKNYKTHRDAIQREKERRAKEKADYELKKKLEAEEKERQRQERRRRRHERKLNELRKAIQEELLVNSEWTEEMTDNIYNINGYYQKTKNVTCLGGPIGQIVLAIMALNKVCPKTISDDKVTKIMENYIIRSHPFYIVYKQDDIETFKGISEDIAAIEDIKNAQKSKFVSFLLYNN